ncbi:MAG TPA: hypothetical protein PK798_10215 [Flavobacteriales bacterium]|nr:hypothetical protein [Flavobacteriales bacterium]HRJ39154.1 hypothetical protein [Flavobacteriales bacterium]
MRLFVLFSFLFCSCSDAMNTAEVKKDEPATQDPGHYPLLEQYWQDIKDSSHQVLFSNRKWIDLYAGDTVSVNPYELYAESPLKNGIPSPNGKVLWLEESPGNFYEFEILELDSFRLKLRHVEADRIHFFTKSSRQ